MSTVNLNKLLSKIIQNPMVVETGADGIWKWRKWSDGTAECWGRTPVTTYTHTTASGKGYYTSANFNLPADVFNSVTNCLSDRAQGTGNTPSNTLITIEPRFLNTSQVGVWINSASSGSQSLSISLYVRGTWDNTPLDPEQVKPFYFQIADSTQTAEVGFKRAEAAFVDATATNPPTINYSSFTQYQLPVLEYSYNNSQWNTYTLGTPITIGGSNSSIVYFRGDNISPWYDTYTATTTETVDGEEKSFSHTFKVWTQATITSNNVKCGGNIMSLRYKDFAYKRSIPCINAFRALFYKCTYLIQAPILPATSLSDFCYAHMFCKTSITEAPVLPATVMKESCYQSMLSQTKITIPPALPATTLAKNCYGSDRGPDEEAYNKVSYGMFGGCVSLTSAPILPATTLAESCYDRMFSYCSSLKTPPTLPATTLANYCYSYMFAGSGITSAPTLSATTLAENCYNYMFYSCDDLTTGPALPATNLADDCYYHMFDGSGITSAPALPATILKYYCYYGMFYNCDSLTVPPSLPSTSLATYCYGYMFYGCSSLTKIPKLPATTMVDYCYSSMYDNSNVTANATSISGCSNACRIPYSGTGEASSKGFSDMFPLATDTSQNYTPNLNTTFYVSVPVF